MGRKAKIQIRLGKQQRKQFASFLKCARKFNITKSDEKRRETAITGDFLTLVQTATPGISPTKTKPVHFAQSKYVVDLYYKGTSLAYDMIGGEAKKLTDKSHKRKWKEALAQALLYSTLYKVVPLVLYDFTSGGIYKKAFGKGNKVASSFAAALRDQRIYVLVYAP